MTELCDIAIRHNTDKAPWQWGYTLHYYRHLSGLRDTVKTVVEVGVWQGASLRTWRDFFPNAMVFGFDIEESCQVHGEDRIKTFLCDAYGDIERTTHIMTEIGEVDFFVDDALHYGQQQISLLNFMWPYIRVGGLYAIEECREDNIAAVLSAAAAVGNAATIENIYAKDGYSLTLLKKGAR